MSPKTKVCLFKYSAASYEVPGRFIDELGKGFSELGVKVVKLDPLADDFVRRFGRLMERPPSFCLSINAVTTEFLIDGKSYHEHLNCPLVGLYIDDPLVPYLSQRLARKNHIATQVSPALTKLVSERFSLPTETLYHAAPTLPALTSSERSIDLFFASTYESPEHLKRAWQEELPKTWQDQIEKLVELAKEEEEKPIWEIWESEPGFSALVGEHVIVPRAELYVRHWRRDRLLEVLGQAGHTVTLVGKGWESCPYTKGHKLLGPTTFAEVMQLMNEAKVALHITPPFCAGSHERPLTAMLAGCATVVDGSPFFSKAFKAGKELCAYSWKDLSTLTGAVDKALKNQQELGRAGQKAVQSAHLWKHRAAQILDWMDVDSNI